MPEGLKIVVGADAREAQAVFKELVTDARETGAQVASGLSSGLKSVGPTIKTIPSVAKPATEAISKLGRTVEALQFAIKDRKEDLIRTTDITRAAVLNSEIKELEREIAKIKNAGSAGFDTFGNAIVKSASGFEQVSGGAKKTYSALRTIANIIPGIGIGGLVGLLADTALGLFNTGEAAKKAAEKIKEFIKPVKEIASQAAAGTAGEAAKVNALVAVVLNQTKSYQERNRALNELKEINKSYFGDLTLETSKLGLVKQAADEYTKAIIQQAVIKAFGDEIGKVSVALDEQNRKFHEASARAVELESALNKAKAANKDVLVGGQGIGGTSDLREATTNLGKARVSSIEAAGGVLKLRKQVEDLNVSMRNAVEESLKFKPLETKTSGTKEVDNIIEQAKKLADFLDKTTQFSVNFEVDPRDSEAETKKKAQAFIDKTKAFFEQNSSKLGVFNFKILTTVTPFLLADPKFFKLITDQAGDVGTRTFKEVKKAFEDSIDQAGKSNPVVIKVTADILTAIKKENENRAQLASAVGLKIEGVNEAVSALTAIQKNAVASANAINGLLTPAFQGLFSSILAGENPLKAFFQSLGDSVIQLVQKLIAAAVEAAIIAAIFPGGIGGVKGFGGFFKNILGFASGGVVSGPTLALIGEGRGTSRSNPEIVAPFDKLKGMLAGMGGSGREVIVLNSEVRGNKLKLLANRTDRRDRRLGGI